ncbi:hypothetical protein WG901_08830 [Novosphingobium sp. PS1R-30]|uniref:Uncharacterized protein n=1 Tax=Novosphingobium anseongense TaxID=3133436 RepID=A0ABU8RUG2_9SPHN|nr:MAG: hypothetical protein EOO76_19955 [Novosphingobium sp.]
MDLNELFFRHQIAVMRVHSAPDCAERHRLGGLADGIASRIGQLQQRLGAFGTPLVRSAAL